MQVASNVAEKFFDPILLHKKELVWPKNSAHSAFFEEFKSFNRLIVGVALPATLHECYMQKTAKQIDKRGYSHENRIY